MNYIEQAKKEGKKIVLIVAPTKTEISPLDDRGDIFQISPWLRRITKEKTLYIILLTNVGAVNTVLGIKNYHFVNHYIDTIIMGGVAGSYDKKINLGETFFIEEDIFADFGFEYNADIKELKLDNTEIYPQNMTQFQVPKNFAFSKNKLNLRSKKGISVNACTGNSDRFRLFSHKYPKNLESMEGAAFFYVCNQLSIPCAQIRAVSNYVNTDRSEWKMELAIENLNKTLNYIIDHEEIFHTTPNI